MRRRRHVARIDGSASESCNGVPLHEYPCCRLSGDAHKGMPSGASIMFVTFFLLVVWVSRLRIERAQARGAGDIAGYARRPMALAAIGAVHGVFDRWGDILHDSCVVGLLMLAFVRLADRVLVALGIVSAGRVAFVVQALDVSIPVGRAGAAAASVDACTSTSWTRMLQTKLMFPARERVSSLALVSFALGMADTLASRPARPMEPD